MLSLLLSATLLSAAPTHFGTPDPARWKLKETGTLAGRCDGGTRDGTTACEYLPRGFWRRLQNFRASRIDDRIYFYVESVPLQCDWSRARELARRQLDDRVEGSRAKFEGTGGNGLLLESASVHAAYVAVGDELVFVELQVPNGLSEQDRRDFRTLLGSLRPLEEPSAYRQGRWLRAHLESRDSRELIPICGRDVDTRAELAEGLLRRATHEQPERFEPWAELGLHLDQLGGGPDVVRQLVAREPVPAIERGEIRMNVTHRLRPLDAARLREASAAYLESIARGAPKIPEVGPPAASRDRATLFARAANAYVRLGDHRSARAHYRSAFDVGEIASWGRLEAGLWLAEDAYAAGDRKAAAELYRATGRAALALQADAPVLHGPLPAIRSRVDRRLAELDP